MKTLKSRLSLKVEIPSQLHTEQLPIPKDSSVNECSLITDNIYISGYKYSIDYNYLKKNNFTHIINCAGGSNYFIPIKFNDFSYYTINLRDDSSSSIIEAIMWFLSFMHNIKSNNPNSKILVHCAEGISRAPALMCSYLMWKMNIDSKTAMNIIKEKRSCIDINIGFIFQLDSLRKDMLNNIKNQFNRL